ncbi:MULTISPECIES: LysR family transcriptional regulator [unclassified Microbacterium]|uniref:LysR family transcriptional regulator n=1 Tax=unclassified Microbacterium TaxID=2609290 RepID=UPI0027873870|nr:MULTISPECIES: LysR family transcriptional regulator [unclassified Microbacterium]MDQ1130387.1 DNA-binding transcriptional LysR family regulator [Microbacterium sp. SORGH_AS_0888]MDQ1206005.1 DNA-binding transcriptional LysR family regulator [Microbacterium sp. SORGH_AS_0862]
MDIRTLSYVIAIAENDSFTAAAEECGIAQPSLSRSIAALEREIGETLFVRGRGGAVPTEAGLTLLPYARAAVAAIERAREAFSDRAGLLTGTLRVGAVTGLVDTVLPAAVAELSQDHPSLAIQLVGGPGAELVEAVHVGSLDAAALGMGDTTHLPGGLTSQNLLAEEVVTVSRPGILPPAATTRLADLSALPIVTYSTRSELGQLLESRLGALMRNALCLADDQSLHIALAAAGAGVAITAGSSTVRAQGPLLDVRPLEPGISFSKCFVWREDTHDSPALAALRRNLAKRLGGSPRQRPDRG